MKVEVHILYYYEKWLYPYIIRHWKSLGARIIIHDGGESLGVDSYPYGDEPHQGIQIMKWDCPKVDDMKYCELRNECWKGTDADWVIVVDADEFVYFPEGADKSLGAYTRMGAAAIRPHGFEMFSETLPTGDGQIYDEIKMGAPEDKWYAKPVLFNPKMVSEMRLGLGSHEADPVLHDGRRFHVGPKWPFARPPCYLLHYHQIGPAQAIADRYDGNITRMCDENKKNRRGNLEPGMKHVMDKRAGIVPFLRQVVP